MSEIIKNIELPYAPPIKGLHFRGFAGETDFPKIVAIIDACKQADNDDHSETIDDLRVQYANLNHCDPYKDMLFIEMDGQAIGYSRVTWWEVVDPKEIRYYSFFFLVPSWRSMGIEEAILHWDENRLMEINKENAHTGLLSLNTECTEHQGSKISLYEKAEYLPERYAFLMKRSLEDIPTAELPEGIVVRPVLPDQVRQVWDAATEAFRDHWGFAEQTEEDYLSYAKSRMFQPHLWQVAWDGDEVVGSVQNFVDDLENKEFNRKRGWTEGISVRRPWRKRGIASALIVRSMHMHKDLGMEEVALGVDALSLTGALDLYSGLGYQVIKKWISYHKLIAEKL